MRINIMDEIYSKIGKIAVEFANVEHSCRDILEYMCGENAILVKPFLIDRLGITQVTSNIRKIAKYRLENEPDMLDRLSEILKNLKTVIGERNLLVHGFWDTDKAQNNSIKVTDFSFRKEKVIARQKESELWMYSDSHLMTLDKAHNLLENVEKIKSDLYSFYTVLRKTKLKPAIFSSSSS